MYSTDWDPKEKKKRRRSGEFRKRWKDGKRGHRREFASNDGDEPPRRPVRRWIDEYEEEELQLDGYGDGELSAESGGE